MTAAISYTPAEAEAVLRWVNAEQGTARYAAAEERAVGRVAQTKGWFRGTRLWLTSRGISTEEAVCRKVERWRAEPT